MSNRLLALCDFSEKVLAEKIGGLCNATRTSTTMENTWRRSSWTRAYQCCKGPLCSNWIWEDKVCEGYVCRKCGLAWRQTTQGFSRRSPSRSLGDLHLDRSRSLPPPGLGNNRSSKLTHVHKATTDLLRASWTSLDPKLQEQLEHLGIKPVPPSTDPDDLTHVLKENMAQLPTVVKELVERITKPPPETEKDMALKLKAQVSALRDLSHRKMVLQQTA